MKNGILYFFNMGNITRIARFLILPLFVGVLFAPFYSIFFPLSCFGFVLSIVLSVIHAPSDDAINKIIDEFESDLHQRLLNSCRAKSGDVKILKGYEKVGKMILRRGRGKTVVYPHLAAIGIIQTPEKCVLMVARRTLLSDSFMKCGEFECHERTRLVVGSSVMNEDDNVMELTFSIEGVEDQMVMIVKGDFHYRDFMSAIQPFIKNV